MIFLEKILVVSFCVFAIWYTMKPGEIFGVVQDWFTNMNEKLKQPLFACPVCMLPWYGTVIYWLIWGLWLKTAMWQEWLIVIIAGLGLNAVIVHFWPPEEEEE